MIEFGEKRWTSYRVLLVDPFPIKKLHKFAWIWISVPKKNRAPKWKFSKKKCHFGSRNNGIWRKMMEVILVKPFPIEKLHKFVWIWIPAPKKKSSETKIFEKNAISKAEMMEFGWKMMNLLWILARWPISNRTAAQICVNLNSGAK